jgi:uncharacterized protein YjcR
VLAKLLALAAQYSPRVLTAAKKWGPLIAQSPMLKKALTKMNLDMESLPAKLRKDHLVVGIAAARSLASTAMETVTDTERLDIARRWFKQTTFLEALLNAANALPRTIRKARRSEIGAQLDDLTREIFETMGKWAESPE